MLTQDITIINKLGLHARAAMQLINTADRFPCSIYLVFNGRELDAKDIMQVLAIGATQGTELGLKTDGEQEQEAMQALVELINNKFGEEE